MFTRKMRSRRFTLEEANRKVKTRDFFWSCQFLKKLVMVNAVAFTLVYVLLCYIATAFLDFDKLIGKPVYFLATVSVLELLIFTYNNIPALLYLIYSPFVMGYVIIRSCHATYINEERYENEIIAGQRAFLLIMTVFYIGQYVSACIFCKVLCTYFLKKPKLSEG